MNPGILGGIVGGIIGILGGAAGTYLSIKNTNGPLERQFMVRVALVVWIAVALFVALLLFLPNPYRWLMWIPYVIVLPLAIVLLNKRQRSIRADEQWNSQS